MSGSTDELEEDSKFDDKNMDGELPLDKGLAVQADWGYNGDATQNGYNSKNGNVGIAATTNTNQIQNFVQTFLVNYYSEQAYKPEILLQVYENLV
jgi:hypothetical protein